MVRSLLVGVLALAIPSLAHAQTPDDQVPLNFLANTNPRTISTSLAAAGGSSGVLGRKANGSVLGVDSLPNWSSYFYEPGADANGFTQFTWPYTMVGRSPFDRDDDDGQPGRTTTIGAPIVPVNIDLRNFDGTPRFLNGKRMFIDATPVVVPALKSPVFDSTGFTSSNRPTQYADAVQRAEFFNVAGDDWHTLLRPRLARPRTIVLIRGTYRFSAAADGTLNYVLVDLNTFVNSLFPPTATDTGTVMGAAENAGDIKTADLSTFLFSNTFLYDTDPANCCILGFHSYDLEPGSAANGWREKRYVMNYSSWISPGLFGDAFTDVTALSHEISEAFNDPFVNNTTPWWLSPNGLCQNNLEDGDVIEGLPNATFPITMNGFTYHPQNEALLQWFAGVTPSSAIQHAYSYPDIGVLTSASKPRNPKCVP